MLIVPALLFRVLFIGSFFMEHRPVCARHPVLSRLVHLAADHIGLPAHHKPKQKAQIKWIIMEM